MANQIQPRTGAAVGSSIGNQMDQAASGLNQGGTLGQSAAANTVNVYAGKPDARQAGDITPSRFRPQYRALSNDEKALHDAIKEKAVELENLFNKVEKTTGRYTSLAMTQLELAVMWIVKELTA